MKNFILGILATIIIEGCVFMYYTCSVQVNTTYTYNPQAVVAMMGDSQSITTTK